MNFIQSICPLLTSDVTLHQTKLQNNLNYGTVEQT